MSYSVVYLNTIIGISWLGKIQDYEPVSILNVIMNLYFPKIFFGKILKIILSSINI